MITRRQLESEQERRKDAERRGEELRNQAAGLERETGHLREALERESALHQRALERIDKLVSTIVEMKREGFVPAPFANPGNLEKLTLELPDEVLDAIEQRSAEGTELRGRLNKWALMAMRQKGADAGQVAKAVLQGGTPPAEEEEKEA